MNPVNPVNPVQSYSPVAKFIPSRFNSSPDNSQRSVAHNLPPPGMVIAGPIHYSPARGGGQFGPWMSGGGMGGQYPFHPGVLAQFGAISGPGLPPGGQGAMEINLPGVPAGLFRQLPVPGQGGYKVAQDAVTGQFFFIPGQ